jgi:hypothetical protein
VIALRIHGALPVACLVIACDSRDHVPAGDAARQAVPSVQPTRQDTIQTSASRPPVVQPEALDWDRADSLTLRIAADSFLALPEAVRADMQRRGCTVPQSPELTERHNVISGAFIQAGRTDWAVVCSIKRASRILVYRAGRADVVDSLGHAEDRTYLQTIGGDVIGFSRVIEVADQKRIEEHVAVGDGPKPPPIDHAGINDTFLGKASRIHYFSQGVWIGLVATD